MSNFPRGSGYAVLSGFEGDADEWAEEYEDLCADQGWSKDPGREMTVVVKIKPPGDRRF